MRYDHCMDEDDLISAGQRLRWARARAGYATAKAAAKALRIGEVSYRAYENDQHGFSKHVTLLARTFGISVEWLMDGGPTPDGDAPQPGELATPEVLTSHYGIELVRKVDITYAMGDGSIVEDYPETEFIPFSLNFLRQISRASTEKLFIASGIGDSMEPTLRRDDLVMIDASQSRVALQDQVWALSYAGAGMIKRVRRLSGGMLQLLSDNPSIPPFDVPQDEIYIVGKVVWSARLM